MTLLRKIFIPLLSLSVVSLVLFILTDSIVGQQVQAMPLLLLDVSFDSKDELLTLSRYDIWEIDHDMGQLLIGGDQALMDRLETDGFKVSINQTKMSELTSRSGQTFFDGYRTREELDRDLYALNNAYPNLTSIYAYGQSYCKTNGGCALQSGDFITGTDLLALRITNPLVNHPTTIEADQVISGTKPVFLLLSALHAREITTAEVAFRFAEWLLENYETNGDAKAIVDFHEVWIIPIGNPDGYELVALGESVNQFPYYQRKNLNFNGCTAWPPQVSFHSGVDLIRNHSFSWGGSGASSFPCDQTYRGSAPASEPEVAHLETLMRQLFGDNKGDNRADPAPLDTSGLFITVHSYGNLVLWPFGDGIDPEEAPNDEGLAAIGNKMASYNGYTACRASCLYPAAGTSDDYGYGELGIPSYTFELGTSFFPDFDSIETEQWQPNLPAFLYAAKSPEPRIRKPSVPRQPP